MNLRLAVEYHFLSTARILRLHIEIVDLQSGIGAGPSEPDDVVLAVVHFDRHFAEAVIVSPDVVRSV